jgi:hypothetical protein
MMTAKVSEFETQALCSTQGEAIKRIDDEEKYIKRRRLFGGFDTGLITKFKEFGAGMGSKSNTVDKASANSRTNISKKIM